jgi:hypothetical protein
MLSSGSLKRRDSAIVYLPILENIGIPPLSPLDFEKSVSTIILKVLTYFI